MLLEPANSVTDGVLTLVAAALAWCSRSWPGRQRYWCFAFAAAAAGALLGTIYHGGLKGNDELSFPTWTVITLLVATTISFLLAATVALLAGGRQARFWLWVRMAGLGAFTLAAATGHAGLGTLVVSESLTMASILVLWWRAWRRDLPGSGWVLLAMAASAIGGVVRILPISVSAGWTFDGTALYHLAQVPGLLLLYHGAKVAGSAPSPTRAFRRTCVLPAM
jgi:hypothetical protein